MLPTLPRIFLILGMFAHIVQTKGDIDFDAIKNLAKRLTNAASKKDAVEVESLVDDLVAAIPRDETLTYLGVKTGKSVSLAAGIADYWKGNEVSLRLNRLAQDSSKLTITEQFSGPLAIYTGTNITLDTQSISWFGEGITHDNEWSVYGLTTKTTISSTIDGYVDSKFWIRHGEHIKYYEKYPIAIPSGSWDFKELAKEGVTLVLADYDKKRNLLIVRSSGKIVSDQTNGFIIEKMQGDRNACLQCNTPELRNFLSERSSH